MGAAFLRSTGAGVLETPSAFWAFALRAISSRSKRIFRCSGLTGMIYYWEIFFAPHFKLKYAPISAF
jgi:hypothetical protein